MDPLRVNVDGGKYTVVQESDGRLHALRHGEPWRDLVGDNLVLALAMEVDSLKSLVAYQREQISRREKVIAKQNRELANLRSAVAYEAAILDTFLIGSGDEFPAHEGERVLINARRGLLNLVETDHAQE